MAFVKEKGKWSIVMLLVSLLPLDWRWFLTLFYSIASKWNRIETWPSGARFEGEYRDDRRNGQGSYWYADGRCYQGEYQDDKPVGEGRRKGSDGSIVTIEDWNAGEFING